MLPVPSERYVPLVKSALDEDLDPHPWSRVRLMRIWTPRGMYQYIQLTYKYILVCTDSWCWLAFTACPYIKHQVCSQLVQQQRCLHVYPQLSCSVSIPECHEQLSFNDVAHYCNMLIHGCTYQYILVCTSMYWYVLVRTILYRSCTFMAWTYRYSS